MCGVIGFFKKNHKELISKGLELIKYRGVDGEKVISRDGYSIGHLLHSIINYVKQPLEYKNSILVSNCEIYNYKSLSNKYKLECRNDSELLIKLINKLGIKQALKELDGVYALAYIKKGKVFLARDLIGVKPLWYSLKPFSFASEGKVLKKSKVGKIYELNPRQVLEYDIVKKKTSFHNLEFFKLPEESKQGLKRLVPELKNLITESVNKRVPKGVKLGVLFSGGVDSTLLALLLKKSGVDFTCYTSGVKGSKDLDWSRKAARIHGFKLKTVYFQKEQVEKNLKNICELIESNNVVKVGVSIPFFFAAREAKKDGVKVLFSGLGSEELFAGYNRFEKASNINQECLHGLKQLYERDLYRDDVITMYHNIELRLPFLDKELVNFCLKIPGKHKINNNYKKLILRRVSEELGMDESIAWRKKKAAQYGSNSDKVLKKLSADYKSKSEYLRSVYNQPNLELGVLFSSGKDSNLALHIMKKQNYKIACLITMINQNSDSYMFHQPVKKIVELQSEAMNIPAIFGKTKGVKEEELKDLKELIQEAKKEYELDGIVTGALFSNYQRKRIKKVCESLGLKTFSPLWHKNQMLELKELLKEGFEFVMTEVAALGLDKSWLNKKITQKDLEKLSLLEEKYGLNVAGEGGEYESLVLNAPFYSKRLKIIESKIVEEDDNTAKLKIKKVILE